MKTAKEAVAAFLNFDFADMKDYNYHSGHYSRAVYATDNGYFCASRTGQDLPKPRRKSGTEFNWVEVSDSFCNAYGWKIFKAIDLE